MKEYRTELVSTFHHFNIALDATINALVQEGWQLESMQALQPNYEAKTMREALLLFSRDRKEQSNGRD